MASSQNELKQKELQRLLTTTPADAIQDPGAYFQELHRQFTRALARDKTAERRFYKIGPYKACFHFANSELAANLAPPFVHLESKASPEPDFTVVFADSRLSGIPLDPPRWSEIHGSRLSLHGDGVFIQFDFGTETLHAFRLRDKLGIFWVKDAAQVFFSEKVCPIRSIFHWVSQGSSLQMIHGGAVGDENGGVILVGRGGSGKSTSCTTSLLSDLFFLGDDYCLVDTGPSPRVYSLYASTKVNPDMLGRFPHLAAGRVVDSGPEAEKPSFLIPGAFHGRLKAELKLKAILMPRVTGKKETRIVPSTAMKGLHALAPSTLFQSTGLGESSFKKMADLSRRLPCFILEAGTDLEGIPRAVLGLLRTL